MSERSSEVIMKITQQVKQKVPKPNFAKKRKCVNCATIILEQ